MILNETPSKRRIIKLKHRRGATVTTKIIISTNPDLSQNLNTFRGIKGRGYLVAAA